MKLFKTILTLSAGVLLLTCAFCGCGAKSEEQTGYDTRCKPVQKGDKIVYYRGSYGAWGGLTLDIEADKSFTISFLEDIAGERVGYFRRVTVKGKFDDAEIADLRDGIKNILRETRCAKFEPNDCCDGTVGELEADFGGEAWSFDVPTCLGDPKLPQEITDKIDDSFSFLNEWSVNAADKHVERISFWQTCETSFYCPKGLVCIAAPLLDGEKISLCTKTCQTNSDCPAGAECFKTSPDSAADKLCMRDDGFHKKLYYDDCLYDWQCPLGQECIIGRNADKKTLGPHCSFECAADANVCPPGSERVRYFEPAEHYACTPSVYLREANVGEACEYDYQCAAGSDCQSGFKLCMSRCASDADCEGGEPCAIPSDVVGRIVCDAEQPYSDSAYCLPSALEYGGKKNLPKGEPCRSSGQCAGSLKCVETMYGLEICAALCDADDPCGDGERCVREFGSELRACMQPAIGSCEPGDLCFEDADCIDGFQCKPVQWGGCSWAWRCQGKAR